MGKTKDDKVKKESKDTKLKLMCEVVDVIFDKNKLKLLTGSTERQEYQKRALEDMKGDIKQLIRDNLK